MPLRVSAQELPGREKAAGKTGRGKAGSGEIELPGLQFRSLFFSQDSETRQERGLWPFTLHATGQGKQAALPGRGRGFSKYKNE